MRTVHDGNIAILSPSPEQAIATAALLGVQRHRPSADKVEIITGLVIGIGSLVSSSDSPDLRQRAIEALTAATMMLSAGEA